MKRVILLFASLLGVIQALFAGKKPNFLIIITDDQTFESIENLNNRELLTPNLNRLVKNGTTFIRAYNQGSWIGAVSIASRTMLITGQNVINAQKNSAYVDNWARTVPIEESTHVKLWGEVMQDAGYETFITGKWHNTDEPLLRSFQLGEAVAEGFYETYDRNGSKDFHYNRPNDMEWESWNTTLKGHWYPRVRDIIIEDGEKKVTKFYRKEQHTSELFADRAIDYLQKEHQLPFFMYVAFNAPHDPRQSPKEFIDYYNEHDLSLPPNFLPDHPFDIGIIGERDEILSPYPRTEEGILQHRKEYYAIISHLDREVGRILDALEASDEADNTHIIFTSDQGLAVGMHGLMGKQNLYEHSIRIPLIWVGPGIKKNRKIYEMVYMQSIFPTTCDMIGQSIPESVDYKSILPLLKGKHGAGEEYILGYFRKIHRMIRSDRYKLIIYPEAKKIQLFDMKKDPYEVKNLADNPKYNKIKNSLFKRMCEEFKEMGDDVELKL